MRREGLMSWLLVAAALAVPSASLYVWLTGTVERAHDQEQTVRRQRETPIFVAPRLRGGLVNPTSRPPEVRIHEEDKPAPEAAPVKAADAPKPAPQPAPAPIAKPQPEPAPVAAWSSLRDPMLSPSEEAILKAPPPNVDAPEAAPVARRRTPRAKPIQDTVTVEAIIALEGIPSAIVNGLAVKVGDMVGKVKVVMITADRVTFSYRSLRFAKSI
ncbi:MAG: hypothetical protein HY077_18880 [Elusimicrobia bacterium]|nr:hypothetical protein [Elusimicrobiota bacterium]